MPGRKSSNRVHSPGIDFRPAAPVLDREDNGNVTGIHSATGQQYSEEMAAPAPEPCRFTIRLPPPLWIGVATMAVVLVAAGLRIALPIWRQQVAIQEIERLGRRVISVEGGPRWLRRLVGNKWMTIFDVPVSVTLSRTAVTDTNLSRLRELRHLHSLLLQSTRISDDGLVHLEGLKTLEELDLTGTRITDAGLMHLAGLTNLEYLSLEGTKITDAGLLHLKGLARLKMLLLIHTNVTETGVADLKRAVP